MIHAEANGLSFSCLSEGSGPLVLLLHGFPDTAHTWEHAMPGSAEAAAAYYATLGPRLPEGNRKRITVPAVAFAGEHDMIAPRAYEKARHWYTSSYEVVQVPGGHFMHREHPQEFTTELLRVLQAKAPA